MTLKTTYPRFRGDVDPAEPHPALILDLVTDYNWSIRPAPTAWHLYEGGGTAVRYAVYFDEAHRFMEASGEGYVFRAKRSPGGRHAAVMLRTFLDHILVHNQPSRGFQAIRFLIPDNIFREYGDHYQPPVVQPHYPLPPAAALRAIHAPEQVEDVSPSVRPVTVGQANESVTQLKTG